MPQSWKEEQSPFPVATDQKTKLNLSSEKGTWVAGNLRGSSALSGDLPDPRLQQWLLDVGFLPLSPLWFSFILTQLPFHVPTPDRSRYCPQSFESGRKRDSLFLQLFNKSTQLEYRWTDLGYVPIPSHRTGFKKVSRDQAEILPQVTLAGLPALTPLHIPGSLFPRPPCLAYLPWGPPFIQDMQWSCLTFENFVPEPGLEPQSLVGLHVDGLPWCQNGRQPAYYVFLNSLLSCSACLFCHLVISCWNLKVYP